MTTPDAWPAEPPAVCMDCDRLLTPETRTTRFDTTTTDGTPIAVTVCRECAEEAAA